MGAGGEGCANVELVRDVASRVGVDPGGVAVALGVLCRLAALDMLGVSLLTEQRAYPEGRSDQVDASGESLVVGNGYARARQVVTGAGPLQVRAPRVSDRREGKRYGRWSCPPLAGDDRGADGAVFAGVVEGSCRSGLGRAIRHRGRLVGVHNRPSQGLFESRARRTVRLVELADLLGVGYVYWWVAGSHFNIRFQDDPVPLGGLYRELWVHSRAAILILRCPSCR